MLKKSHNSIKFPGLLYKPIRSVYYTLKGNIAMSKQDFDSRNIYEKAFFSGYACKGSRIFQYAANGYSFTAKRKIQEDWKLHPGHQKGLPDKEKCSCCLPQMCSIMMNKREFRTAKDFFRKAKACKPTTSQIVDQMKQIEKNISRMPGTFYFSSNSVVQSGFTLIFCQEVQ